MNNRFVDANKIASWYINNNKLIEEDIENRNYKRLMTIMAYSQIEALERLGRPMYRNQLSRDGIVVSISNLIPSAGIDHKDIPRDIVEILESLNMRYGLVSTSELDKIHLELLDRFYDRGGLKNI